MGAYTSFRTVAPGETAKPESGNDKDIRSRQIDELIAKSEEARRDAYGPNNDQDDANFYLLNERDRKMPTFRPRISAPQLQLLLMNEVADLTDSSVKVFIHKGDDRDEDREEAFQMHWRQNFFQLQLVMAQIYAQFSGVAFLEVGNDPFANRKRGNVWMRARQQGTVYCDPISWWPPDWSWQVVKNKLPLDKIKQIYGKVADGIKPRGQRSTNLAGPPAGQIEMPPGPMSVTMRGLPTAGEYEEAAELDVRTCYILDYSVRELTETEKLVFHSKQLPIPKYLPKYPQGRMVVDCEGTILSDGEAWLPLGDMWPNIPVWATPPWDTVWSPNPKKYTKSLQDAAEQQMSQVYENGRRLNNGFVALSESSGLTANTVGGLPGEIVMIAANCPIDQGIKVFYPPAFPAQMIELPKTYLALQKELRGATPARAGNTSAGNVGADLFEAAINQSQSGTRLTAKFFAFSVQRVCELLFYTMAKSFNEELVFYEKEQKAKWEPIEGDPDAFNVQLPEGSIRPMSTTALRNMVIELKKIGALDVRSMLQWLDVPDADKIANNVEAEMKLAALAKLQRK